MALITQRVSALVKGCLSFVRRQLKKSADFFKGVVFISIVFIVVGPVMKSMGAQTYNVMLVDTAVSNRLAEEWEPQNRYQHERGYCVYYDERFAFTIQGPVVVYTLRTISRAAEERTTKSGIGKMSCPDSDKPWVFLHTHPPAECTDDVDSTCVIGGAYSNQCFPSPTDQRTLENSDKPFALIQCDGRALVPYWRRTPLPLDHSGPSPLSHR